MRKTVRKKAEVVCHQKATRDRYLAEGLPPGLLDPDLSAARVRKVSRSAAERVILKYEWLGTMSSTSLHYGIFFGVHLAGVACVALGSGTAGPYVAEFYRVRKTGLATLARGACVHWAPNGANSKLVSWTVRLLRLDAPERKVLVAYSDPDAGEIGTIYQACGWVYVGRSNATHRQFVSPEGAIRNDASIGQWGRTRGLSYSRARRRYEEAGWRLQGVTAKGRYAIALDRKDEALSSRLRELSEPYPKRRRCPGGTPGSPARRGRFDSDLAAPSQTP